MATSENADAANVGNDAREREPDEAILQRLAALPLLEYDRQRESAAQGLGCRVQTLNKQVEARRPKPDRGRQDTLQGCALNFDSVEPWPECVNGAEVLDNVAETFSRYVVLPDGAADALALWCGHAHAFDAFDCSPRLNIWSPEKQCGKTTLRDVLAVLVPRPVATENLTLAVLFRLIQSDKPTILADECDAWLNDNEELRGLLNAGHGRGGRVYRCVGDSHEVRGFEVFAPAVLCGIGSLPGTLHDRSIGIRLERAKQGELRERFDRRRTQRERELCRKLLRFTADNFVSLETCDPVLPPGAFNRRADNWRPLFAVAEAAGGDWPERAADAFEKLTGQQNDDAQGVGVMLLTDTQKVFSEVDGGRIFSRVLIASLCDMTDRPWLEANRGMPISETWLARRLSPFGISPRTLRIGDERAKGYKLSCFVDAFERYLPAEELSKRDSVTRPENNGDS